MTDLTEEKIKESKKLSATGRNYIERINQDRYETPEYCIDLIFDQINTENVKSSLEPCRASGRIYNRLSGRKYYAEISEGKNYFKWKYRVDLIVTNPPFSIADRFLLKSLREAKCVIYLLRLNFLGSQKRKPIFDNHQPTHLYVLSRRPSFIFGRTDATEYAWFVWDQQTGIIKNEPGIYVL